MDKKIICKICGKTELMLLHKKGYLVPSVVKIFEEKGWLLALNSRKKSVCPACNMLKGFKGKL